VQNSPNVTIKNILFNDGSTIELGSNDIVVIVGPNNSGKSLTLRSINDKITSGMQSQVIDSITITKNGDNDDLINWIESWTITRSEPLNGNIVYQSLGHALQKAEALRDWSNQGCNLRSLARWFCNFISAEGRLQICNPPSNIAISKDNPTHPIHFLLRDDSLEQTISERFKNAFGFDLVVHRNAGSIVPIHMGEKPPIYPEKKEDRVSLEYVKRLEELPELHKQGDGMRSFAGLLLATSVAKESILLIDEPEAFLHPPQARLLGESLVHDRQWTRQIFIATHSSDIIRGILNAESPEVRVIRIVRNGNYNIVHQLDSTKIGELWRDSLLRYSNILDGLFHEKVVICESDSDCRFYSAVLDAVIESKNEQTKRPDIMFTHCGGKQRIPTIIKSLREVDVPVVAVVDFDIFSDEYPLRSIVQSLGAEWNDFKNDWTLLKKEVDQKKPDLSTPELKKQILAILDDSSQPPIKQQKKKIQGLLKKTTAWSHAKTVGKSFVPSGQASRACENLLKNLQDIGLFVVEIGEIEGFYRQVGDHGPKWVNEVLNLSLKDDPNIKAAREFVSSFSL